jgi:hypothetical protein
VNIFEAAQVWLTLYKQCKQSQLALSGGSMMVDDDVEEGPFMISDSD